MKWIVAIVVLIAFLSVSILATIYWFAPLPTDTQTAWATWFYFLATCAVLIVLIVAGFAAYLQLREMERASRVQTLNALTAVWESDRLRKTREKIDDILRELRKQSGEDGGIEDQLSRKIKESMMGGTEEIDLAQIPNFFDWAGKLTNIHKAIQKDVIEMFRDTIIYYYKLFKPAIDHFAEEYKTPDLGNRFDALYRQAVEAKKLALKQRGKSVPESTLET